MQIVDRRKRYVAMYIADISKEKQISAFGGIDLIRFLRLKSQEIELVVCDLNLEWKSVKDLVRANKDTHFFGCPGNTMVCL